MKVFVLINEAREILKVKARNIAHATIQANDQGFIVFDWEIEEGEDF